MSNSFKKNLVFLLSALLLISVAYLYIDKSFAFWSHNHHFAQYGILKAFTHVIEILSALVASLYIYCAIQFFFKRSQPFNQKLLMIGNTLALTFFINQQLKFVFGRYWPETWNGNLSLIENNAYGFHFFHNGGSFPSGHSASTFALAVALWIAFPKLRWLAVILPFFTIIGQLGMNFHFVSDVIAGSLLGSLIACCSANIMKAYVEAPSKLLNGA